MPTASIAFTSRTASSGTRVDVDWVNPPPNCDQVKLLWSNGDGGYDPLAGGLPLSGRYAHQPAGGFPLGVIQYYRVDWVLAGSNTVAASAFANHTFNRAPGTPGAISVTSPVSTTGTISWGAATDPDGDALTYTAQLSTDNGATWSGDLFAYTSATSVAYNFVNAPRTTVARVRVIAYDGQAFSGWTTSAVFSINRPPNAPTPTSPANNTNIDRQTVIRLAATFSDPDPGDSPSASDWRYRIVGAAAWTTAYQSGPIQSHDIAAGVAAGDYEWQARYYDAQGLVGPYSASAFFTASNLPVGPTITAPVNNSTVSTASVNVVWSYPAQQAYQVRALDGADALLFDSGIVESSTARSFFLDSLPNNVTRKLQVRIRDGGLWSAYSTVTVTVSYTIPAAPGLALATAVDGDGQPFGLTTAVTNPVPGTGQPTVTQHDIYVRCSALNPTADRYRPFTEDGTRVKAGVVPAGTWTDAATASGVDLEYRVVSHGTNGTTSTSAWIGGVFDPINAYPAVYASTY